MRSRYLGKQLPTAAPLAEPAAAPEVTGMLRVRTLGDFAVWHDGQRVPAASWGRRRVAGLFKYLLGAPGFRAHREQLLEALFADMPLAGAAKGLRAAVYLLRKLLDEPGAPAGHLQWEGDLLTLTPAPAGRPRADWLDAAVFERTAEAALAGRDPAPCRAALALYGGEYLPEDRYEEWAERRRAELRGRHLAVLLHLASLAAAAGEQEEALRCLRTVLTVDPCHEAAARDLMELLAREGRTGEALEVYRALVKALEEEVGAPPARETRALRARVLASAPLALVPDSPRTNLPAPLTSFVGREWERAEIDGLLRDEVRGCRLLTLLGPGGCGKTRLAVEVARGLLAEYPDGVFLAELATLADEHLLPRAVAGALRLAEEPHRSALAQLTAYLAPRRLLLVLDNCEHLVAGCATLAAALLQAAPRLRIVTTSQAALGVLGEQAWRVPSLSLPERSDLPPVDLPAYEAVQLFIERARAAQPRFALTERNARAVLQVCRRLDGIPLALELAAARLSALSVEQLTARLDDRFALLTAGNRTALPRQQTLRATIEWSYNLLSGAERLLLQRLSVFVGGWTLEAAEAVCAGPGLPERMVLERLDRLVARSLVQVDEAGEALRYRLLESVRAYAQELGEAAGERRRAQLAHLDWYLALAKVAAPAMHGPEQAEWLARLETEHDNLRAALRRSVEHGSVEDGLRLAVALWWFWSCRGYLSEGRRWLEEMLAAAATAPSASRAAALHGAGALARQQGDFASATALLEESLALRRELGDTPSIATVLGNLGIVAYWQGEYGRAATLYEEALALKRALGEKYGIAAWLNNLGLVVYQQGDYERAMTLYEEALALQREVGDMLGTAGSLGNMGEVAHSQGEYGRARILYEEALALQRQLGDRVGIAISLGNLGEIARLQGELTQALALHEEGLALQRDLGDRHSLALSLLNLGAAAYDLGDRERTVALYEESLLLSREIGARDRQAEGLERLAWLTASSRPRRAAQVAGAAETLRVSLGMPLTPAMSASHTAAMESMRAALGDEVFAAAWSEGCAMTLEDAVALALAGLSDGERARMRTGREPDSGVSLISQERG